MERRCVGSPCENRTQTLHEYDDPRRVPKVKLKPHWNTNHPPPPSDWVSTKVTRLGHPPHSHYLLSRQRIDEENCEVPLYVAKKKNDADVGTNQPTNQPPFSSHSISFSLTTLANHFTPFMPLVLLLPSLTFDDTSEDATTLSSMKAYLLQTPRCLT